MLAADFLTTGCSSQPLSSRRLRGKRRAEPPAAAAAAAEPYR